MHSLQYLQSKLDEVEWMKIDTVEKCKAYDKMVIDNDRDTSKKIHAEQAVSVAQ